MSERLSASLVLASATFEHAWRQSLLATTEIARPDDGGVADLLLATPIAPVLSEHK